MKNFLLVFCLFVGVQNDAFSQSKIIMGGGVIASKLGVYQTESWVKAKQHDIEPFIGFSYQNDFSQNLFFLVNLNYTKLSFESYQNFAPITDGIGFNGTRFVQISTSGLLNYKVFSSITKAKFWNGFYIGLGLNIDHMRDFQVIRFGSSEKLSRKENRNQLGFISNLSWEHKKFKLTYNLVKAIHIIENRENLITSTDWSTLSASYIYTLNN